MRAWGLHQQGWSQGRIARELGVTQGAVSQWIKRARDGGIEALRQRPAPGRQAALTEEQLAQFPALLDRGAEAFGFEGDHWTAKRFAAALKQSFGVTYHMGHITRLLRNCCPDWQEAEADRKEEQNENQ